MRKFFTAMAMVALFANFAFAADNAPQQEKQAAMLEQRKAEITKKIDERINNLQEKKSCVQAASTKEALKACREKFKREMKEPAADKK